MTRRSKFEPAASTGSSKFRPICLNNTHAQWSFAISDGKNERGTFMEATQASLHKGQVYLPCRGGRAGVRTSTREATRA